MSKFLITSLPHSRTAWMAAFMCNGTTFCRYETVSELNKIEDLANFYRDDSMHANIGVSDCALSWFLPWIMENIQPRTLIIERDVAAVNKAMAALGIPLGRTNYCDLQIERLRAFRNHPLVKWVTYDALNDCDEVRAMQEHLTPGAPFDAERYSMLRDMHIETDLAATQERVRQRQSHMTSIMREIAPLIRPV